MNLMLGLVLGSPCTMGGGTALPYLFDSAPVWGVVADSTSAIDARGVNTGTVGAPILKGLYRMNTSWMNHLNAMTGWAVLLNYPVDTTAKDSSIRSHTTQYCRGTSRAVAGSQTDEHVIWLPEYIAARPGINCITLGPTINAISVPGVENDIIAMVDYAISQGVKVALRTMIPTTVGGLGDGASYVANFERIQAAMLAKGAAIRAAGTGFLLDSRPSMDPDGDGYTDNGSRDTWDGYHRSKAGAYRLAQSYRQQMVAQRVMNPLINVFSAREASLTNLAPTFTQSGGSRANPVLTGSTILGSARMAGSNAAQLTTAVASTVNDPTYGWIQRLTITPNLTESAVNFQMTLASSPQTIAGMTGKWIQAQARMRMPNRPGIGVPSFQIVNVTDTPVTAVGMYAESGTGSIAIEASEAIEWCIEQDPIKLTGDTFRWTFQFNGDMTKETSTEPFVVDFIPPRYFEVPDPTLTVGTGVN